MVAKEKLGPFVRRHQEAKGLGLRELAKRIGISPTYLSKVERGQFGPPAEGRVKAIAEIIQCDADDLLARADRISSDISAIIKQQPVELTALLRSVKGLNPDRIARLARAAQRAKKGGRNCGGLTDADEHDSQ